MSERENKSGDRSADVRLECDFKIDGVRSIYKYARISPFKVREITREIQGLRFGALDILAFTPKKAAFLINKRSRAHRERGKTMRT